MPAPLTTTRTPPITNALPGSRPRLEATTTHPSPTVSTAVRAMEASKTRESTGGPYNGAGRTRHAHPDPAHSPPKPGICYLR